MHRADRISGKFCSEGIHGVQRAVGPLRIPPVGGQGLKLRHFLCIH